MTCFENSGRKIAYMGNHIYPVDLIDSMRKKRIWNQQIVVQLVVIQNIGCYCFIKMIIYYCDFELPVISISFG